MADCVRLAFEILSQATAKAVRKSAQNPTRPFLRLLRLLLPLGVLGAQPDAGLCFQLKSATIEGFARYVQATEARIQREVGGPGVFLHFKALSERRRAEVHSALQNGEVIIQRLQTRDPSGREILAPGGLIHHSMAAVFIPGASVRQALDVLQDYDHHQDFYKPQVVRSRLLHQENESFKVYYRLLEKKIIKVVLSTEYEVHWAMADTRRWYSRSYSTRIAEVQNADRPDEWEKPAEKGRGFLWRLNSYWRLEEQEGGVYAEYEFVALTRDVPWVVAWLIRPLLTRIPKETLERTLRATRSAVLEKRVSRQGRRENLSFSYGVSGFGERSLTSP